MTISFCLNMSLDHVDQAAQKFSKAFYHALIMRHSVKDAFDIALALVNASPSPDDGSDGDNFLLLPEGESFLVQKRYGIPCNGIDFARFSSHGW